MDRDTCSRWVLVVGGLTTKEHIKGRKNGVSPISVAQRCCMVAPSEIDPRRLVPTWTSRRVTSRQLEQL